MKIAIPVTAEGLVSGHAGQARNWLVYDCQPAAPRPLPAAVALSKAEILHHFEDDGPHPLDGVDVVIAASAGDGFVRHMARRGADVLLTGEKAPDEALARILAGDALPDARFDITTTLCRIRDLFSRH